MSDQQNLVAGAAEALSRLPRTTFTIPESSRLPHDPKTVTLRQLTYAEEKAAMEAEKHGGGTFVIEGAKRALCATDSGPGRVFHSSGNRGVHLGPKHKCAETEKQRQ